MAFGLNEEQSAAVAALKGGVLISAGAGSGKTRTLTERFVHALTDAPDEAWAAAEVGEILAITFTDKAAGELSERVRRGLRAAGRAADARRIDAAWISTIHGFCSRLLRRHALEAGLDPDFAVADSVVAAQLREGAFDRAARHLLGTQQGEALFAEFDLAAVFRAVESLRAELRSHGLGTEALRREGPPTGQELLERARALFAEGSDGVAACGDTRSTASAFRESCLSRMCALDEIAGSDLPSADLARAVWEALESWRPGRSVSTFAETHEYVRAEHQRLLEQSAAAAAGEFSAGLQQLITAYDSAYQTLKRERGILDFDDLQVEALRLLRQDTALRTAWQNRFRLVMVDEFQDTDALQLDLVRAVGGDNLCTVGDEHQSIYRFRGADVGVYRTHNAQMLSDGARSFALRTNYRSHAAIIDFVNAVFGADALFGSDLLRLEHGRNEGAAPPVSAEEPRVELLVVPKLEGGILGGRMAEADAVARRFARLRDEHAAEPGGMVVLLRTYSNAHIYADALQAFGFRTAIVGGSRFFGLHEVSALRALLRTVANPHDELALAELMASDLGGLSDDALWLLRRGFEAQGVDTLWDALRKCASVLPAEDRERADSLADAITACRERVGEMPLSEVLLRAVEELNYDVELLARGAGGAEAFANVLKLARMADSFEASSGAGPAAFAAYLDAKESYGDHTSPATLSDEETQAVRLLSIHASKGLEFPHVAVVDLGASGPSDRAFVRSLVNGGAMEFAVRLPSEWSTSSGTGRSERFARIDEASKAEEVAEAKRLLYVACTRAEETLTLAGSLTSESGSTPGSAAALDWLRLALRDPVPHDAGSASVRVGESELRVTLVDPHDCGWDGAEHRPPDDVPQAWPSRPSVVAEATVQGPPSQMSFSQFAEYERCSLRFWAERILRVGGLALPGSDDSAGFGSAVHAALEAIGDVDAVGDDRIEAVARAFGLDPASRDRLAVAVRAFLQSSAARELRECSRVDREARFATAIESPAGRYLLRGSIDAYGRMGDRALIVDYKTGTSGRPDELAERYRLQASLYALVALRDGYGAVRVVFSRPEVEIDGAVQEIAFEFSASDATAIEERLAETRSRIERGEFKPLEQWDRALCGACPIAEGICPLPRGT